MSLNSLPSTMIPRTYHLYWCYNCHRTVRILPTATSEVFCPRCNGQFLNEIDVPRPRLVIDLTALDHYPGPHLLEAFSSILRPRTLLQDQRETETEPVPGLWVIFRTGVPVRPGRTRSHQENHTSPATLPPPPLPEIENDRAATNEPRNYFVGPGLSELIEELTENDRPGPPPAPPSAIETMPTIKIKAEHLMEGSNGNCPVCKEEFEVGEKVREMGCMHIYHSECIVPWLQIHNSCPVCRHQLPTFSNDVGEEGSPQDSRNERRGRRTGRWNSLLPSLWHFFRSDHHNAATHDAYNSWWRSWFLH